MTRYYRFAGIELSVQMPKDKMHKEEYRLAPFRVGAVTVPQTYTFQIVDTLEEPQGICIAVEPGQRVFRDKCVRLRYIGSVQKSLKGAYIRVSSMGENHEVQLLAEKIPEKIGSKMVLNVLDLPHLLAQVQGVVLHCSYIVRNGKAILFTAPSGVGKSTQADLWNQFRDAEIINGDRAAVRIEEESVIAEGVPFSGSSPYCKNRSVPVEAIVYLGQDRVTSIRRLDSLQAFKKVLEGVSVNLWDKQNTEKVLDIVRKIVEKVPVFHLTCTPDESAVIALEQALKEREQS